MRPSRPRPPSAGAARPGRAAPLLVAEGVEKEYRTKAEPLRVLKGVTLTVHEAELVAVVGASGVGKSTLLHVLGALDRPDGGIGRGSAARTSSRGPSPS